MSHTHRLSAHRWPLERTCGLRSSLYPTARSLSRGWEGRQP
jgi:hypothetical protein